MSWFSSGKGIFTRGPLGEAVFPTDKKKKKDSRPTTTVKQEYDPEVSKMQLTVGQRQQEMAEEQWELYKEFFLPYEQEAAKANIELLPLISDISKEFYRKTTEGIDVGRRMDEAQAEVIHGQKLGKDMRRREISQYGIDPGSSTYANLANLESLETAKNIAGARTSAKTQAEAEEFARLGYGLGKGAYQAQLGPGADPYARAASGYSGAGSTYASLANRVLSTTRKGPEDDFNKPGSFIGGLVGTGIGAYYGGPKGAAVGYGIGSGIGGMT
jgi:hypothetical protein